MQQKKVQRNFQLHVLGSIVQQYFNNVNIHCNKTVAFIGLFWFYFMSFSYNRVYSLRSIFHHTLAQCLTLRPSTGNHSERRQGLKEEDKMAKIKSFIINFEFMLNLCYNNFFYLFNEWMNEWMNEDLFLLSMNTFMNEKTSWM